ncbi:DnaJ subfamily B protein [Phytophthora cinnamomi]|uniref:DnaJ subfamily B protein n=1 Tax=Phytophthora cinnamomi TaxID=4785 RepID=UPI00355AAE02|nr:DnaJ subfamily B protein [Phytophthora cinnamomi]
MAGASPKKNGGSAPQTPKQSPRCRRRRLRRPSRGPDDVDADELTALIKAIKFAHPEFGVKRIHDQVATHGGKFARVPFKRVKRYMHKLGMNSPSDEDDKTPVKLMTVGGDSKSLREGGPEAAEAADDSAVIRMTTSEEGDAEGSLGEIYKIQVAMEADGSLSTIHPMLVYNKARTRKTFLHPDSPAYLPVQRLVTAQGQKGSVGGSKAYFWGRYFKIEDMLYINTEKIAPAQQW